MKGVRSPGAGSGALGTKTLEPGEGRGEGKQLSDLTTISLPSLWPRLGEGGLLRPHSCRGCQDAADAGQSRGSAPTAPGSGHGAGAGCYRLMVASNQLGGQPPSGLPVGPSQESVWGPTSKPPSGVSVKQEKPGDNRGYISLKTVSLKTSSEHKEYI